MISIHYWAILSVEIEPFGSYVWKFNLGSLAFSLPSDKQPLDILEN